MHIVIDKKGSSVSYQSHTLIIRQGNERPERIPLSMISSVCFIGNTTVEASLLPQLAKHHIATIFMPLRTAVAPVTLGTTISKRVAIRHRQHRVYTHWPKRERMAEWVLAQKYEGYTSAIPSMPWAESVKKAVQSEVNLSASTSTQADNIAGLMGVEGAMAAKWFKAIECNLDQQWRFTGRNRRPPKDPVNVLMSLSYTLMSAKIEQQLTIRGLDPSVGFLHHIRPGRNSLVLDLIEGFRPQLDSWCLSLLTEQWLSLDDFTPAQDGCLLNKAGRQVYFQQWAAALPSNNNKLEAALTPAELQRQIPQRITEFTVQLKAVDRQ